MAEKRAKRTSSNSKSRRENLITLIVSVIIAVVAWVILSITAFSDITVTLRDVPIDFSLEGYYADISGLSVVDKDIDKVNVSFVGQRDSVGNYTSDDIKVSLDLNSVRTSGSYDIPIIVTSVHGDQLENIEIGPQKTVHIEFDRFASKQLTLDSRTLRFDTGNITAAMGCVIDEEEITVTPSQITVSGPQDYIDQVTSCVLELDQPMRLTESTSVSNASVKLYSGDAVFENPKVSIDTESFNVYIPVYYTRQLPIDITLQSYSDKIDVSTIPYSLSESSILVRSQNSDIDKIANLNLGYIEVRYIRPGTAQSYEILQNTNYENISGIENVQVRFELEGYAEKNINIPNSQIYAINGTSDFNVTVDTDRINVTVVGPQEVLDTLDASSFVAEIDLMDYNLYDGSRFFTAAIYAPGHPDVWALGVNQVLLQISPIEQVEAPAETDGAEEAE